MKFNTVYITIAIMVATFSPKDTELNPTAIVLAINGVFSSRLTDNNWIP